LSSIPVVPLRTSPFSENQVKAFQRDFHLRPQVPVRTYVYAYSPVKEFIDEAKAALANGEYLISTHHLLDVWA
jgi:hypothetical protein